MSKFIGKNKFKTDNKFKEISKLFYIKSNKLKIILIYNIAVTLGLLVLYYILPKLLLYPPNFQIIYKKIYPNYDYTLQQIIAWLVLVVGGTIIYSRILRDIDDKPNVTANNAEHLQKIAQLRKKCLTFPYSIYIIQIAGPLLLTFILNFYSSFITGGSWFNNLVIIPIIILVVSTLIANISLLVSKKVFTHILLANFLDEELALKKIGLKNLIFLQILPMLISAILFTSLLGYSQLIEEKSNLYFKLYHNQLIEIFSKSKKYSDISHIQAQLEKIKLEDQKGCYFIISPENKIITSDRSKLPRGFIDYLKFMYHNKSGYNGRVYDANGQIQGAIIKIKSDNADWIVGVKYEVASKGAVTFFIYSFIILVTIGVLILYYFSSSLVNDISLVADNLTEIAEGAEVDLDKKIPVTSNDEIGDLVVAFNKIQDREKQHIRDIKENQRLLLERERLAALGQMIGGIAHNLRSPIMSIAGGLEALKDLVKEYDESVDNVSVTKEDHHEIAKEMMEWIESMRPYCSFMSDLISAVREQAVQLNASTHNDFTLEELVKRIEILLKFELKQNNCTIETDVQVDMNTIINGEVNNLVQVCNNLIINAIQAYDGQGGKIELKIFRQDKEIVFIIKDYGKGIPPEVKDRLLKEMITTKGKRGTGLGLFMSSLTIKGKFGGDLWFESEEGKGSTFYFSIPCS